MAEVSYIGAAIGQNETSVRNERGKQLKRVFSLICVGLGVTCIVLSPLFRFYVAPSVAQTPLDNYTQSTGVGVLMKQLDPTKVAAGDTNPYYPENLPITNTRYTKGDVLASEQDPALSQNLAVFDTFSRTNTEDGRLVIASTSRYAFGRQDSVLANCCGAAVGGNTVNFTGNMPLKFPFFVGQQSYNVWDDTLLAAVPTNFVDQEDHYGVNTYKFQSSVAPTLIPNSSQDIPAKVVGQPGTGTVTVNPYYSNDVTYWIEPLTGQIVDSQVSTLTTFRGADGQTDLLTYIQLQAGGDPTYVQNAVPDIKSKASQLNLVLNVLPIVLLILGILLLVVGIFLTRSVIRDSKELEAAQAPPPLV